MVQVLLSFVAILLAVVVVSAQGRQVYNPVLFNDIKDRSEIKTVVDHDRDNYRDTVGHIVTLFKEFDFFPQDYNYFLRTANYETGLKPYLNGRGGIWGVSRENFQLTNTILVPAARESVNSFLSDVQETLVRDNITLDWDEVVYEDLDKPLYSALAASILTLEGEPYRVLQNLHHIDWQVDKWVRIQTGKSSSSEQKLKYGTLTQELEDRVLPCRAPMDLLVLIDGSRSGSEFPYHTEAQKNLTRRLIKNLNLSNTRLGVVGSGSDFSTILDINDFPSGAMADALIRDADVPSGPPATNKALGAILQMLKTSPQRPDIPKTAVIFSNYRSSDGVSNLKALVTEYGIRPLVVTLDIAYEPNPAYEEELKELGNGQQPYMTSSQDTNYFEYALLSEICKAHIPLVFDTVVRGFYEKEERLYYEFTYPPGAENAFFAMHYMPEGTYSMYISSSYPYPNDAEFQVAKTMFQSGDADAWSYFNWTRPESGKLYFSVSSADFGINNKVTFFVGVTEEEPKEAPWLPSPTTETPPDESISTSTDGGASRLIPGVSVALALVGAVRIFSV